MPWHVELATLEGFQRQQGVTDDLERYRFFIRAASRFITSMTRRWFVPYVQTRTYDARGDHISSYCLKLDADLLAVDTLTNGDGTEITSADYVLERANEYPKSRIVLTDSASQLFTYSDDWQQAISVAGTWGYHERYAWIDTNENVPVGDIAAADLTFTLNDVDARDAEYRPRVETFRILKIDDELIRVMAVDTDTNVVTVLRGQLGTTAAAHTAGTDIYSWQVHEDITQACIALAVWLERGRDVAGETIQFLDGTEIVQNQVPANIMRAIRRYARSEMFVQ